MQTGPGGHQARLVPGSRPVAHRAPGARWQGCIPATWGPLPCLLLDAGAHRLRMLRGECWLEEPPELGVLGGVHVHKGGLAPLHSSLGACRGGVRRWVWARAPPQRYWRLQGGCQGVGWGRAGRVVCYYRWGV